MVSTTLNSNATWLLFGSYQKQIISFQKDNKNIQLFLSVLRISVETEFIANGKITTLYLKIFTSNNDNIASMIKTMVSRDNCDLTVKK